MKFGVSGVMVFLVLGIGAMRPTTARAADVTFSYEPKLPSISHQDFFSDEPGNNYFGQTSQFTIRKSDDNEDIIRNGVEFRIFSLFPTDRQIRDGTLPQSEPDAWNNQAVGDCLVYLSLVYRPDSATRRTMLRSREFDLGPLGVAAGWLPVVDQNNIGHGYYLMVVEKTTPADPPSIADYGGLGMRYEFIRLAAGKESEYFRQGLHFGLSGPVGGSIDAPIPNIVADRAAFQTAALRISHSLHCYGKQIFVANPLLQSVAALQPCKWNGSEIPAGKPMFLLPSG